MEFFFKNNSFFLIKIQKFQNNFNKILNKFLNKFNKYSYYINQIIDLYNHK